MTRLKYVITVSTVVLIAVFIGFGVYWLLMFAGDPETISFSAPIYD
jgi:hypothetical protein